MRRFLNSGALPPKDAVRIEELVNYFTYDYPEPNGGEPFSINLDVAGCPWQPEHRLVRIGLRGRDLAVDDRSASNLVFLLDVSGLMEPGDGLARIKQSVRLLVDKLTEKDRVAIVAYANDWGLALPSTTGEQKEKINHALEKLLAGGSANVASGIELAYRVASDNFVKDGINRVILGTDGDFDAGLTGERDLVQLAKDKARDGIFLTVLGMGNDNLKDSAMRKIADKANGNYVHVDSLSEARKVLRPADEWHARDDREGCEHRGGVQSRARDVVSVARLRETDVARRISKQRHSGRGRDWGGAYRDGVV